MAQTVSYRGDVLVMTLTDEVEQVVRVKIHRVLTYLYTELCKRKIFERAKHIGSRGIYSDYELFEKFYADIKNDVCVEFLLDLGKAFFDIHVLPMPQESFNFIKRLPKASPHAVYRLCNELMFDEEDTMLKFIHDLCDRREGLKETLSPDLLSWFINYATQ